MKRRVRQSFTAVSRTFNRARSYALNLIQHNNYHHSYVPSTVTRTLSESDSDGGLESASNRQEEISQTSDTQRSSATIIPCEFCSALRSSDRLLTHQVLCLQNPDNQRLPPIGRRSGAPEPIRRSVSDSGRSRSRVLLQNSRSVRPRTPSPTDGVVIPEGLQCPITAGLFRDPVLADDGHTYEREAITQWIKQKGISPMTRDRLTIDTLRPNRAILRMAENFRAECERKKALFKYKIDVDVKKTNKIPFSQTNDKTMYLAEWIKNRPSTDESHILLMYLTGDNAEKLAELNCRLGPHPHIVRTFGRVEHDHSGILLLQEYTSEGTLSQFLTNTEHSLSISIMDNILSQIISALKYLASSNIVHGNITAHNILIFHWDEIPENILIKLTNVGDIPDLETSLDFVHTRIAAPEVVSKRLYSEKSDVFAVGLFGKELYAIVETKEKQDEDDLARSDHRLIERQALFDRCMATNPDDRPPFSELAAALTDLMNGEKCILSRSSCV